MSFSLSSPAKNSGEMLPASSPPVELNTSLSYLDSFLPASSPPRTGYQGRLYPNGEFSLGAVPPRKKLAKDSAYDALLSAGLDWRSPLGWAEQDGRIQKSLDYSYHFDWAGYQALVNPSVPDPDSLDVSLSDVSISNGNDEVVEEEVKSSPRAARGSKGLSVRGRRQIRNGCYLLRQKYRGRLGLLTLTLPSFPFREDLMGYLIGEWSELLHHFLIKLSRLAKKRGFPGLYVGCVEIQPERFERFGHPCPHAHIVYVCRKRTVGNDFYISADEFREVWRSVIQFRLNRLQSDDPIFFEDKAAVNCIVLKKDPARYISKYLAKGRNPVEEVKKAGLGSFLPSGWVICCSTIKSVIQGLTTDIPYDYKVAILEQIPLVDRGICIYLYKIEGEGFAAGYSGQFACGTPASLNPL